MAADEGAWSSGWEEEDVGGGEVAAAVSAKDQILGFSEAGAALLIAGEDFSSLPDFFCDDDEEGEDSAEVDEEFRQRGLFSSPARRLAEAAVVLVAVAGEVEDEKDDFSGEEEEEVGETTRLSAVCLAGRPGL